MEVLTSAGHDLFRKYWRRFEAINQERRRKGEVLMAEEREMQKYPLVGAHEDGRQAEGARSMSLASWRRIENARRAGEEKRRQSVVRTAAAQHSQP